MNPVDRQVSTGLQDTARQLNELLKATSGQDIGFCLFTFPPEAAGRASYISNCDRQDVADAVKQCLDLWREGMPDVPTHEVQ